MQEMSEQVLKAIDIIVDEKLSTLKFDTTEVCMIVGIDNEVLNTYRVKFNNITFTAKAEENITYKVNDKVNVLIPQGDLNASNKIILGKVSKDDQQEHTWKNPRDRVLEYAYTDVTGELKYANSNIDHMEIVCEPDAKIWDQFIRISSLKTFDFIILKTDVYSYLGQVLLSQLPKENQRFWVEILLCDEQGNPLHSLVEDAVSPLVFLSDDIDGDPYSQVFDNNTYYKVWNFPKDDIADPTQIRKIKLRFGCDGEIAFKSESFPEVGIKFSNIKLSFGYDLDRYIKEDIILAIPSKDEHFLTDGYMQGAQPPNITAWVVREDDSGLFRDKDFAQTQHLANLLNFIGPSQIIQCGDTLPSQGEEGIGYLLDKTDKQEYYLYTNNMFVNLPIPMTYYIPRYTTYHTKNAIQTQYGQFYGGDVYDSSSFAQLTKAIEDNLFIKNELYKISDAVIEQAKRKLTDMEGCIEELDKEQESSGISKLPAENSIIKNYIVNFFQAYEDLIDILLKGVIKNYALRWYRYQFGAKNDIIDSIGGGHWVPIGRINNSTLEDENFEYYLGTTLNGTQYGFSINAKTDIQAILCQEGTKREKQTITIKEDKVSYSVYANMLAWQKLASKIMTFTNRFFDISDVAQTDYLTIKGHSFLNIYNYNNRRIYENLPAKWNQLTVDFIDDQAKADMALTPETTVTWTLLNQNSNQIKYFKAPTICNTYLNKMRKYFWDRFIPDNTEDNSKKAYDFDLGGADETKKKNKFTDWVKNYLDALSNEIPEGETQSSEEKFIQDVINLFEVGSYPKNDDEPDGQIDIIKYPLNKFPCYLYKLPRTLMERLMQQAMDYINTENYIIKDNAGLAGCLAELWLRTRELYYCINNINEGQLTQMVFYYGDVENDTNALWRTIQFEPRDTFDIANNQSQVRCSIGNFSAIFNITFSLVGSAGTDYVFTIEPIVDRDDISEEEINILKPGKYRGIRNAAGESWSYRAVLRDTSGNELTDLSGYNVKWEWHNSSFYPQLYRKNDKDEYVIQNQFDNITETSDTRHICVTKKQVDATDSNLINYFTTEDSELASYQIKLNEPYIDRQDAVDGSSTTLVLKRKFRADYLSSLLTDSEKSKRAYVEGQEEPDQDRRWEMWLYNTYLKDLDLSYDSSLIVEQGEYDYYYSDDIGHCITNTNGEINPILRYTGDVENDALEPNNHILKAVCTVPVVYNGETEARDITLTAYYPIAVYDDYDENTKFQSADGVFYLGWDANNELITPHRDIEGILDKGTQYTLAFSGTLTPSIQWSALNMQHFELTEDQKLKLIDATNEPAFPRLAAPYIITAKNETNKLLYQVPILTAINTYSINAINEWSGAGVYMDNEQGTILTAQMGAGYKDSTTGEFTGIMLGNVLYNSNAKIENGIFGYNQGQEYFRLTTDGRFQIYQDEHNKLQFENQHFYLRTNSYYLGNADSYISGDPASGCSIHTSKFTVDIQNWPEVGQTGRFSRLQMKADSFSIIQGMIRKNDLGQTAQHVNFLFTSQPFTTVDDDMAAVELNTFFAIYGDNSNEIFTITSDPVKCVIGTGTIGTVTESGIIRSTTFEIPVNYNAALSLRGSAGKINKDTEYNQHGRILIDDAFRILTKLDQSGVNVLEYNDNGNVVVGWRGRDGTGNTNIYTSAGGTISFATSSGTDYTPIAYMYQAGIVLQQPLSWKIGFEEVNILGYDNTKDNFWIGNNARSFQIAASEVNLPAAIFDSTATFNDAVTFNKMVTITGNLQLKFNDGTYRSLLFYTPSDNPDIMCLAVRK